MEDKHQGASQCFGLTNKLLSALIELFFGTRIQHTCWCVFQPYLFYPWHCTHLFECLETDMEQMFVSSRNLYDQDFNSQCDVIWRRGL